MRDVLLDADVDDPLDVRAEQVHAFEDGRGVGRRVARDRQLFAANVRQGRHGTVVVIEKDNGRSGEMTFGGVGLTQAGANKGTVSGTLKWTCAP